MWPLHARRRVKPQRIWDSRRPAGPEVGLTCTSAGPERTASCPGQNANVDHPLVPMWSLKCGTRETAVTCESACLRAIRRLPPRAILTQPQGARQVGSAARPEGTRAMSDDHMKTALSLVHDRQARTAKLSEVVERHPNLSRKGLEESDVGMVDWDQEELRRTLLWIAACEPHPHTEIGRHSYSYKHRCRGRDRCLRCQRLADMCSVDVRTSGRADRRIAECGHRVEVPGADTCQRPSHGMPSGGLRRGVLAAQSRRIDSGVPAPDSSRVGRASRVLLG